MCLCERLLYVIPSDNDDMHACLTFQCLQSVNRTLWHCRCSVDYINEVEEDQAWEVVSVLLDDVALCITVCSDYVF